MVGYHKITNFLQFQPNGWKCKTSFSPRNRFERRRCVRLKRPTGQRSQWWHAARFRRWHCDRSENERMQTRRHSPVPPTHIRGRAHSTQVITPKDTVRGNDGVTCTSTNELFFPNTYIYIYICFNLYCVFGCRLKKCCRLRADGATKYWTKISYPLILKC